MNILYFLDNPQLYGSELHLLDIILYIKTYTNYKVAVVVFKTGPLLDKLKEAGITYYFIPTGYAVRFKTIAEIKKIIKENNYQLVHAHQPKALFIGSVLKFYIKIPLICTVHTLPISQADVHIGIKKILVLLFHHIILFFSEMVADKLIFVSKFMLSKTFFKRKSVLVYNWIRNFHISNKVNSHNRKKIIRICAVGSVTYAKGYDKLFEFLNFLICSNVDFQLVIVGGIDNVFLKKEKQKYKNAKLFDNIIFCGHREDVSKYYSSADFFILLTRFESFGLAFIEAMSFGLPVIAPDIPVMHEIIPSDNCITNDFIVMKKFLLLYFFNKKLYIELANKNKKYVQDNFNLSKSIDETITIYQSVLAAYLRC